MINLLPPARKADLHYAHLNRLALGYLRLVILILVIVGGVFAAAIWQLGQTATRARQEAAATKATLAKSDSFKKTASDVSARLASIKTLESEQTRFSQLIRDLGAVLPEGVAIKGINLTGDDTKPVRVSLQGKSYNAILSAREALASSRRIQAIDLESVSESDGGYEGNVVFSFKKGQAK